MRKARIISKVIFATVAIPLLLSMGCKKYADYHNSPAVKKGVLDLREWDLDHHGPMVLRGEWEYYPQQFIKPEKLAEKTIIPNEMVTVPGYWNNYKSTGTKNGGSGFATYHVCILPGRNSEKGMALLMPTIETACAVYANGKQIYSAGVPGKNRSESRPGWKPAIVEINAVTNTLDLVFHISNFDHVRGGPGEKIVLGIHDDIEGMREYNIAVKMLFFGCLFIMSLYHGVIFLQRKNEKSALYFAIFCFLMALRSLLIEDFCFLIFIPSVPWSLLVRLTYSTFSLGFPVFVMFIDSLYPAEMNKGLKYIFIGAGITYSLLVALAPPLLFTMLLPVLQIFIVLASIYGLYVLVLALTRKRKDALLFLSAFIFYFFCIINDTLHNNMLIRTGYIAPSGFIIFIFLQSVLLSKKYSRAFIKIEKLFEEKTKLEGVKLDLESLSYLDQLTGIANRRRFDEYLYSEWRRSMRTADSLSLIMIDIDCFKEYNDRYGHIAGDLVLKKISGAMAASFSRAGDFIARYGGEEFAVILPSTAIGGAGVLAEKIRKNIFNLAIPHHFSAPADVVTISLGYSSVVPGPDIFPESLIEMADQALYRAKNSGRNRISD